MKIISVILFSLLLCQICGAQSLAINTDGSNANSSAILDVKSITKGLLIPRMNKAQRIAIATPANGLLVYQNAPDSTGFYFYDGSNWELLNTVSQNNNNWKINGNSGTIAGVNYIGTSDYTDLSFGAGGFEEMRLTKEVELGIGDINPEYTLDISTGEGAVNDCINNGIRVRSSITNPDGCNSGLLMGYSTTFGLQNDALIWNYGQAAGLKNLIFGVGDFEKLRLNENGLVGISEQNPLYTLDIRTIGSLPCGNGRRGIRIDGFQGGPGICDRGLFLGYDQNGNENSTSIWNFTTSGSNDRYLRFGFGSDFSPPAGYGFGEVMRILPQGQGVGIGIADPLAMIHIRNAIGSGAMPGLMATDLALPDGSSGFYTGLQISTANDAYVWNYQNAPILFGTNDISRMQLRENGNFVFGNPSPVYRSLHAYFNVDTVHLDKDLNVSGESFFADTVTVGSAIATPTRLHVFGETVTNELQVTTLAAPGKVLTSDLIGNATWEDPVNYWTLNANDLYNNNTGNTGIGVNNPAFKLDVGARMRIRSTAGNTAGLWLNNDANTTTPSFIGMRNDSLVGFYGSAAPNSGWGMLMNTNSGRVGIGTDNPAAALHVIGNIIASGTITPSDLRYKTNIRPIQQPLKKLLSLNGVSYLMNSTGFPQMHFDNDMQYGLIAQEVEKVFPEMVKQITADGYKGIDYVKLVPVLIEGFKALNEKIDQQQKEIELLKKEK